MPPVAPSGPPEPATPAERSARPLLGSFVGMGGMACVLFLVFAAVSVAPWYAMVGLITVWVVLFVLGTRWFMTRPWRVAALPLVMLVVWFGTVAFGALALGWKA